MKVLVVGSGGREHAICWKLRQCSDVESVYCAPGNPGIESAAICVPYESPAALAEWAKGNRIDLTVVGPEQPLSEGIVDLFRAQGLRIFGPTKAAALLEASKAFTKDVLESAGVPTAAYRVFEQEADARAYIETAAVPLVVKADGLAAGKGVFICRTRDDAREALGSVFSQMKSVRVVIEQFLEGKEASFIIATDGRRIVPLPLANDYKRIRDNDEGPNTGGMGAVSPTPNVGEAQIPELVEGIIVPTLRELERRGIRYTGFLYAGLMISPAGDVHVLEYNARLGDPETQAILRRCGPNFASVLFELADPVSDHPVALAPMIDFSPEAAVCVVLASEGYPESPRTGDVIEGVEFASSFSDAVVFHAGTRRENARLVTNGGRVLSVTATAPSPDEARMKAYKAADMIQFRGRQLRRDIAR